MKNSKAVIAVLCIIVLIFSFAACTQQKAKMEKVAQVVTNENGEVVTGVNGEAITEEVMAQVVTDSEGKAVTEVVTGTNGKPLTTVVDKKYVNVTQVVTAAPSSTQAHSYPSTTGANTTKAGKTKKSTTTTKKSDKTTKKQPKKAPEAPSDVTNLTASSVTKSSVKLSWSKVSCFGYQVSYSTDLGKTWSYIKNEYKSTSITVNKLESNTLYIFRVRAYNQNSAGKTPSKWKTLKVKTKVNTDSRKIKINVQLPTDSNIEDELTVEINNKEVKKLKVKLDGSTYSFTTSTSYKGEVEVYASLKDHGSKAIKTDKNECDIEVGLERIPVIGEDED
ncbi:MAG: fibronectin type III domain-containing protein [Eubacterium sp.]|nr:fibronectin type III domain-containing protein [Eubacterium sp.]